MGTLGQKLWVNRYFNRFLSRIAAVSALSSLSLFSQFFGIFEKFSIFCVFFREWKELWVRTKKYVWKSWRDFSCGDSPHLRIFSIMWPTIFSNVTNWIGTAPKRIGWSQWLYRIDDFELLIWRHRKIWRYDDVRVKKAVKTILKKSSFCWCHCLGPFNRIHFLIFSQCSVDVVRTVGPVSESDITERYW